MDTAQQLFVSLNTLSDKTGLSVDKLHSVLTQQAKVEGSVYFVENLIIIFAMFVCCKLIISLVKQHTVVKKTDKDYLSGLSFLTRELTFSCILVIILLLLTILLIGCLNDMATALFNSDFYILTKIQNIVELGGNF